MKDMIAYMLVRAPTKPPTTHSQLERYENFIHPSLRWASGRAGLNWFYFTPQGVALFEPVTLRRQRPGGLLLASRGLFAALRPRSNEAAMIFDDLTSQERAKSWLRAVLGLTETWERKILSPDSIKEVVLSPRFHDLALKSLPQWFQDRCRWKKTKPSGQRGTWFTWTAAKNFDGPHIPTFDAVRNLPEQEGYEAVALWQLPGERVRFLNDTLVSAIWKEYIGGGVIPFDQNEREAQLAYAYEALAERIERWRGH